MRTDVNSEMSRISAKFEARDQELLAGMADGAQDAAKAIKHMIEDIQARGVASSMPVVPSTQPALRRIEKLFETALGVS